MIQVPAEAGYCGSLRVDNPLVLCLAQCQDSPSYLISSVNIVQFPYKLLPRFLVDPEVLRQDQLCISVIHRSKITVFFSYIGINFLIPEFLLLPLFPILWCYSLSFLQRLTSMTFGVHLYASYIQPPIAMAAKGWGEMSCCLTILHILRFAFHMPIFYSQTYLF